MWKSTPALPTNTWYPVREAMLKAGLLLVHVVVDQGVEAVADLLALGEGEQGVLSFPLDLVVDHLSLGGQLCHLWDIVPSIIKRSKRLTVQLFKHSLIIFYLWEWWDMPEATCTTLRMTRSPAQLQRAQSRQRRWRIAEQGRDPLWNRHRAEPTFTNTKIQRRTRQRWTKRSSSFNLHWQDKKS